MKPDKDILHAIRTVQVKSNIHVHEFLRTRKYYLYTWLMRDFLRTRKYYLYTWLMRDENFILWNVRDEKIHFMKYEGWKNSFCEMWGKKKFILWNVRDSSLDYVNFDLTILPLKNNHVQGTWWIQTKN